VRYLIMSEPEFEAALSAAQRLGKSSMPAGVASESAKRHQKQTEAACRARPADKLLAVVEAAEKVVISDYALLDARAKARKRLASALTALEEDK